MQNYVKKSLEELVEEMRKIHSDFKVIDIERVVVAEWVRWKCTFGCKAYGKHLNCPPFVPPVEETRKLLKCYSKAILARFEAKKNLSVPPSRIHHYLWESIRNMHEKMFELERFAFISGYHKAFAFYALPCSFCEKCVAEELNSLDHNIKRLCRNQLKVRPSMEAAGIDVFQTARNAGYKVKVLASPDEEVQFFGLLLLE